MDLVTGEQMRERDRRTIDGGLVPSLTLMERAGRGLLASILRRFHRLHQARIVIVCGRGNNGGDGLVLARLLRDRGLHPQVFLAGRIAALEGDAATNAARAGAAGLWIRETGADEIGDPESAVRRCLRALRSEDLLVDALLGTGLRGPARGDALFWIQAINASPARVVAVDIPSGLHPGETGEETVRAEWTVTMGSPKLSFAFHPGRSRTGEVDVVDIGIPETVSSEVPASATLLDPTETPAWLPAPGPASHKGDWGKLLIAGGSPGLSGAVALAARAALRSGAGLVRAGVPGSLSRVFDAMVTEAMSISLPEGEDGQLLAMGAERLLGGFGDWDALVLGPGLGRSPEGERFVMRVLSGWRKPLLIDADGLNALAAWGPASWVPPARDRHAGGSPGGCVLTPHLGEMSRLSGRPIAALAADPVGEARNSAVLWGVTVALKGAPSVIAAPTGEVWVNPTGNSGLATGGSGDVLSGIIGTLLAQGLGGPRAAALGCYLHGLAADIVVEGIARRSLIPGDVVAALPEAFRRAERGEDPPRRRWRRLDPDPGVPLRVAGSVFGGSRSTSARGVSARGPSADHGAPGRWARGPGDPGELRP